MAGIKINVDHVDRSFFNVKSSHEQIVSAKLSINNLGYQVDSRIRSRRGIDSRFRQANRLLNELEEEVKAYILVLEEGSAQYRRVDDFLSGKLNGDIQGTFVEYCEEIASESKSNKKEELKVAVESKYSKDDQFYEKKKKEKNYKDLTFDAKNGQVELPGMTKYAEDKATVFGVEAKYEKSDSFISGEDEYKSEYVEGSYEYDIGTYEGTLAASVGVHAYDKNGNIVLAPEVNAKAAIGVAGAKGKAQGAIGLGENKDLLGLYGSVDSKVGAAEASAELKAMLFSKDGQLDPEIKAGVKAEAIGGEVGGTVGISALGTKAGVTGNVNYGVGVHAEAGFVDGKIKVDLGASLGVGVSVGVEIDFSGTIDALVGAAESAFKFFNGD